jgi:hypothetical protein
VALLKPLKERAPVAIVRFMPIGDSLAQGESSYLFGSRQKRLGEQAGCSAGVSEVGSTVAKARIARKFTRVDALPLPEEKYMYSVGMSVVGCFLSSLEASNWLEFMPHAHT